MSHTDKTTPTWVVTMRSGVVTHDHRLGVCAIEPLRGYHRPAHKCAKREVVTTYCTKREPNVVEVGPHRIRTCWVMRWDDEQERMTWRSCSGHKERTYDATRPCVCDRFAPRPTCWVDPPQGHKYPRLRDPYRRKGATRWGGRGRKAEQHQAIAEGLADMAEEPVHQPGLGELVNEDTWWLAYMERSVLGLECPDENYEDYSCSYHHECGPERLDCEQYEPSLMVEEPLPEWERALLAPMPTWDAARNRWDQHDDPMWHDEQDDHDQPHWLAGDVDDFMESVNGWSIEGPAPRPEPLREGRYVRVWEVARDLGLTSKRVLEVVRELDEYVKTHQSYIALPVVKRVKDHLQHEAREAWMVRVNAEADRRAQVTRPYRSATPMRPGYRPGPNRVGHNPFAHA